MISYASAADTRNLMAAALNYDKSLILNVCVELSAYMLRVLSTSSKRAER